MKLNTWIMIPLALLVCEPAALAQNCRAVQWPFARHQAPEAIFKTLEKVKRESIKEYLYYELTTPAEDRTLARKLSNYMTVTEQNKLFRGLYETLAFSANLHDESQPQAKLELAEICTIEAKLNEVPPESDKSADSAGPET